MVSTNMTQTTPAQVPTKKQSSQLSQADLPAFSLSEAMRIPNAIRDNYALDGATPLDLGKAIGLAPTTGKFRMLTGSAIAFGLTNGGYNAGLITLTDLGRRIVAPTFEGEDKAAMMDAFEKPRIIREFVAKYNGKRMPPQNICENVLVGMGVPFASSSKAYALLIKGLTEFGYIQQINDGTFIQRPKGGSSVQVSAFKQFETSSQEGEIVPNDDDISDSDAPDEDDVTSPTAPKTPNAIFLGHGKNKKPLEQLIKILDEYGIQHKEAINEANAGRPIPVKVAETMRECGAAILIFSADEKYLDEQGNEIWRPSENVAHELGAASILYENRIVVFKEDSVSLASNFSSIGYINFEKDKLDAKGIDLFRELVKFKIISVSVGS